MGRCRDVLDCTVPLLVVADGLTGLSEAVAAVFPKASFQCCVVHLVRNTWPRVRMARRQELCDDLKRLYKRGQTVAQAQAVLEELVTKWHASYPGLLDTSGPPASSTGVPF